MIKCLVLILLVPSCYLYSQNSVNCKILNGLLRSSDFRATFKIDKNQNQSIVVNDIRDYFGSCLIDSIYGKDVKILKDTSGIGDAKSRNIIIYKLTKIEGKYKVEVHQKYTGAYGFVEFKNAKNKVILLKFSVGYF
jgi:hypothetical protein